MRGDDEQQASVWSYIPLEQRIPVDHPLRAMRAMVDEVLRELSPQFSRLYAKVGRPSIAPERLLRALLLQVLYRVRSAVADGAARLQPALPLVRGPQRR